MTDHIGAGRFAPSPTGALHAGHLLTAGLAWRSARRQGLRFILRLEDLDTPRVRPATVAPMVELLQTLGLEWDEGWDKGGPQGTYRQSERRAAYGAALEKLRKSGHIYPCACSRAEVARSAPHGGVHGRVQGGENAPVYRGKCRTLPAVAVLSRCVDTRRPPAWRFRVAAGEITFKDGARGDVHADPSVSPGDFVIARGDSYSYQLAVVVDDAAMGVTEVLRGGDLLDSTPRQLLLYQALNLPPPRFIHGPLLLNGAGIKLSKRDGALAGKALLEKWGAENFWRNLISAVCPGLPTGQASGPAALDVLLDALPDLPRELSVEFRDSGFGIRNS